MRTVLTSCWAAGSLSFGEIVTRRNRCDNKSVSQRVAPSVTLRNRPARNTKPTIKQSRLIENHRSVSRSLGLSLVSATQKVKIDDWS
uniref:Putative secreted protein n=1 Tax=Anopheles marajoara TaxID=58244 RepID=A0A2M4CAF8_9DIPT